MAQLSIGEAIGAFLKSERWTSRIYTIRIKSEWEQIMGKTIARYTKDVKLSEGVLTVFTEVAALKQELQFGKPQIIANVNAYFKDNVVKDVKIQ